MTGTPQTRGGGVAAVFDPFTAKDTHDRWSTAARCACTPAPGTAHNPEKIQRAPRHDPRLHSVPRRHGLVRGLGVAW